MPSTKSLSCSPIAIMNRGEVIGALNRWKWPVAGVAAAFVGSLYTLGFSQVFHLYAADDKEVAGSSSYGVKGLLKKLIHDFIQGGKSPENPPLSPNEASMIIRKNEKRVDVNCGVVYYYDTNNLPSNNPMEDRNTECRILKTNGVLFSVFDGHGGWQCAEAVKNRLPLYIALSLLNKSELGRFEKEIVRDLLVTSFYHNGSSSDTNGAPALTTDYTLSKKQDIFHTGPKYLVQSLKEVMDGADKLTTEDALSLAYSQLDDDISAEAIPVKMLDDSFVVGATGACAVSAYLEGDSIYLANSGDCRVVLGSKKPGGSWVAHQLTEDQNSKNENEYRRLLEEHPGEEGTVIKNDRLLGQLQPLRAFGDIQYKWDKVTHSHILTQVYGGPIVPPHLYKTPPYLTAKPVTTKHQIQNQDKFIILASDGLWDSLSSQQAVELVGQFLDSSKKSGGEILEKNAATHLIRHAIGGNDHHFVAQMLLVPEQYRRMWRDDITVTVVFLKSDDLTSKL